MSAPLLGTGALSGVAALAATPLIGFGFGWFLERAGMGHPRKLAAQFYLRDLTVFKVMFSALVTALLGVFWLTYAGILDGALLYVPDTFVLPQLVGGALFGVGFVLSGLCPGTSCVAAASGRLDGFAVMAGLLAGVLCYALLHPLLVGFASTTALGPRTLPELLRLPTGVVAAIVALVALAGFVVAERIERRTR